MHKRTLEAAELAALLASMKVEESEPLPSVCKEPEPESIDSFEPVQRLEFTLEAPEIVNMKKEEKRDISKLDTFKQIVSYSPYVKIALDPHSLHDITKNNESQLATRR